MTRPHLSRRAALGLAPGLLGLLPALAPVRAQAAGGYPSQPVRVINQSAPGNTVDVIARIVSDRLAAKLGQQVIVLNRPGAGGLVATREAAAAAPDGHHLYFAASSAMAVLPFNQSNLRLDVNEAFVPVGFVAELPLVVAVRPDLGVETFPALLDLARTKPGGVDYAGTTPGALPHLSGLRLAEAAGAALTFIPYQGGAAQSLNDMAGGRVSMIIESVPGIAGALKAGTIRPLAVLSEGRLPDFPDLPTASEFLPGFVSTGWLALLAPRGTPAEITDKVALLLREVVEDAETRDRLTAIGAYPRYMAQPDLARFIRAEQQVWEPVVRRSTR